MRVFLNILLGITITAITLWGVGALYFSPLLPARWRAFAAVSYAAVTVLAFALLPSRGRTAIAALAIFAILVILFFRIPASNDRDWQPDVAVTPYATVNGDLVTIHGVRETSTTGPRPILRRAGKSVPTISASSIRSISSPSTGPARRSPTSWSASVSKAKITWRCRSRRARKRARAIQRLLVFFDSTSFITSSPTSAM